MKHVPPTRIGRRQFLKSSNAIGLASALPALLASCGGGDDDDPPPPPAQAREARDCTSTSAPTRPTCAWSRFGSAHHDAELKPHTTATRQATRSSQPALAGVADEHLTHYLEQVDLPAAALQTVFVRDRHPISGEPVLCGVHMHVPRRTHPSGRLPTVTMGA